MQLLDTLTLPTAQFTSLSILLQLHHQDFSVASDNNSNHEGRGEERIGSDEHYASKTPKPTLRQCRSMTSDKPKFIPVYAENSRVYYVTDGRQSVSGVDIDDAAVVAQKIIKEATIVKVHYDDLLEPYYTISVDGKEKQTDNSHLSLSPDGTLYSAEESAGEAPNEAVSKRALSHSVLRHDLTTLSPLCLLPETAVQGALDSLQKKTMIERGMRDDFCGIASRNEVAATDEKVSVKNEESKTAAKDKTEEGSSGKQRKGVSFHHDTKAGKETLQPVPDSLEEKKQKNIDNSVLPLKIYRPPSSHTQISLGFNLYYVQLNIEDLAEASENATTFKRIMAVLLPDISLASLKPMAKEKQSGVILLTVAITGPSYDLYGCSSVMHNLPNRLREAITTLAAVDTTPKKEEIIVPRPQNEFKTTKSNKMIAISHFNKNEGPSVQTKTVVYDSAYFQRLYLALLSTIMDDEDGLLRDHDMSLMDRTLAHQPVTTNKVKDISKPKTKLFTFSRKSSVKSKKYESGEGIDGDIVPLEIPGDQNKSDNTASNAEIVRRTALQMEILSLAEDDMSLPKYQHAGESDRRRHTVKSPKAGGGVVSITAGRFGRKETQFDLAGFDYRPSFGAAGSVSGTASTMASSDDVSTATGGDDTATLSSKYTMLSNASSVPTLSKSKKDSSGRSSRFKFLQKKKESKTSKSPSKPPLPSQSRQIPMQQEVFDPFSYDADTINEEQEYKTDTNETNSIASDSAKGTPERPVPVMETVSRSFSEDESEARSLPTSAPPTPVLTAEEEEEEEPLYEEEAVMPVRYLDVDLALNEDLTCEYKKSKLSSLTVDGTVQVRVKNSEELPSDVEQQPPIPFFLIFQDYSQHIKSVQENKKFVEHVDIQSTAREYTYSIALPRENEYFPVVRYRCSNILRPVPIRVQSRVRTQGKMCRVALQISSNPSNNENLVQLTIIMGIPKGIVKGHSLQCNPPGGTYNEQKSVVLWCVSELGGGEKFQLQAMFELEDEYMDAENDADATAYLASKLEFPVLARCQCPGAQLSDIALDVMDITDHYPAEISGNIVRRFRVSHKEK